MGNPLKNIEQDPKTKCVGISEKTAHLTWNDPYIYTGEHTGRYSRLPEEYRPRHIIIGPVNIGIVLSSIYWANFLAGRLAPGILPARKFAQYYRRQDKTYVPGNIGPGNIAILIAP